MDYLVKLPGNISGKITKWKVTKDSTINQSSVLAFYQATGSETISKLKCDHVGTVKEVMVLEGAVAKPGETILVIEGCKHPTLMKDMCAECGADLRETYGLAGDRKVEASAVVAMVHSVPELIVSKEEAIRLGRKDEKRYFDNRKLALLVDLDQTLIHTTNDNIPNNLKDVFHFQLWNRNVPSWFHTKFRPRTEQFLQSMAKLFELHICTFGVRAYAHTIARFMDPDGTYFSHRILSRDECFNPTSKTANLKALFPCGDSMVCIIDDREDVWSGASNLIQVKPYIYFDGTADINAPPAADKARGEEGAEDTAGENGRKPVRYSHLTRKVNVIRMLKKKAERSDSSTTKRGEAGVSKEKQYTDAAKVNQPTDAAKEKQPTDATKEKQPTDATKEKQPTDATKEKQPTDATKEKQPTDATREKQPTDAAKEKQHADAAKEKQPADAANEKQLTDATKEKQPTDAAEKPMVVEITPETAKTQEKSEKTSDTEAEKTSEPENVQEAETQQRAEAAPPQPMEIDGDNKQDDSSQTANVMAATPEKQTDTSPVHVTSGEHNSKRIDSTAIGQPGEETAKCQSNGEAVNESFIEDASMVDKCAVRNDANDSCSKVAESKQAAATLDGTPAGATDTGKLAQDNITASTAIVAPSGVEERAAEGRDSRTDSTYVQCVVDIQTDESEAYNTQSSREEGEILTSDSEKTGGEECGEGLAGEDYEELIEWEDTDDYLIYLEDILKRIHTAYFEVYDQMKQKDASSDGSGPDAPDLKSIIPYVKRKVLKGATILFSGVIPTNQPTEKSRALRCAKTLGATVVTEVAAPDVTHVVAAKLGTAKVKAAQKLSGVHLVNPDWLWTCAERWEWVDERLFPLTEDSAYPSVDSPAAASLKPNSKSKGSKKTLGQAKNGRTGGSPADPLSTSSEDSSPSSSAVPQPAPRERSFSNSYNPLHAFNQDELEKMDKEVEEIFDEDSESEGDSDEDLRRIVLGYGRKRTRESSSDEDSLSGEFPKGWKKKQHPKRRRADGEDEVAEREQDDVMDDDSEQREDLVENPGCLVKRSDHSSSSAEDGSDFDDSVGSVDEEMAAAIEREFLSY